MRLIGLGRVRHRQVQRWGLKSKGRKHRGLVHGTGVLQKWMGGGGAAGPKEQAGSIRERGAGRLCGCPLGALGHLLVFGARGRRVNELDGLGALASMLPVRSTTPRNMFLIYFRFGWGNERKPPSKRLGGGGFPWNLL